MPGGGKDGKGGKGAGRGGNAKKQRNPGGKDGKGAGKGGHDNKDVAQPAASEAVLDASDLRQHAPAAVTASAKSRLAQFQSPVAATTGAAEVAKTVEHPVEVPCEGSSPALDKAPEYVGADAAEPACSSGEAPLDEDPEVCGTPSGANVGSVSQEPMHMGGSGEAPLQEQDSLEPAEPAAAAGDAAAPEDLAPESTTNRQVDSSGQAPPDDQPEDCQVGSSGQVSPDDQPEICGAPNMGEQNSADVLQAGGSGEAPLQEEVQKTAAECVEPAENLAEEVAGLTGDYHWRSNGDENIELTLRIRSGGQWCHAAHRSSTERGRIVDPSAPRPPKVPEQRTMQKAYKDWDYEEDEAADLSQLAGNYEEFEVWELAETIGSWREVQILSETMKDTGSAPMPGVLLTCDNCSWKSNYPNAPLTYRPSAEEEEEVDAMLGEGQLVLCFIVRTSAETGGKCLELHMDLSSVCEWTGAALQDIPRHSRLRGLQTAFQKLGFTKAYMEAHQSSSACQPSRSADVPETA